MLTYFIIGCAILAIGLCWAIAYMLGYNHGVEYTLEVLRKERSRHYDSL